MIEAIISTQQVDISTRRGSHHRSLCIKYLSDNTGHSGILGNGVTLSISLFIHENGDTTTISLYIHEKDAVVSFHITATTYVSDELLYPVAAGVGTVHGRAHSMTTQG